MWWRAAVHHDSALFSSGGVGLGLQKCFVMEGQGSLGGREGCGFVVEGRGLERERANRREGKGKSAPLPHGTKKLDRE